MKGTPVLLLNEHERLSSAWLKVKAFLEAELDNRREKNDNNLSPEKTAWLRGQIEQIKIILKAGDGITSGDETPEQVIKSKALLGE